MTGAPRTFEACSLLVATPLYDGAQGPFLRALLAFSALTRARGLPVSFAVMTHQPSISRARSGLVTAFLQGEFTHLLFIDSDIGFEAEELLGLVETALGNPDLAVIGAPCPRRLVNWPTVAAAAKAGLADGNPAALEKFSGDFAFELLDPGAEIQLDRPVELARLGTGLMLIRRDVAETLRERHPELAYVPSALERAQAGLGETAWALFQPMIDPATRQLLSDDWAFCHRARAAGFRIWLAPWMRTSHTGPATFNGALADLAPLFHPATSG